MTCANGVVWFARTCYLNSPNPSATPTGTITSDPHDSKSLSYRLVVNNHFVGDLDSPAPCTLVCLSLERVEVDPNAHGPQEHENKQTRATDLHVDLNKKNKPPGNAWLIPGYPYELQNRNTLHNCLQGKARYPFGQVPVQPVPTLRKRGGAPRNLAPRNHFWGGLPNHEQIICKKPASQSLAGCACETSRRVSTPPWERLPLF